MPAREGSPSAHAPLTGTIARIPTRYPTNTPADAPWADGVRFVLLKDSEGNLVLVESRKDAA